MPQHKQGEWRRRCTKCRSVLSVGGTPLRLADRVHRVQCGCRKAAAGQWFRHADCACRHKGPAAAWPQHASQSECQRVSLPTQSYSKAEGTAGSPAPPQASQTPGTWAGWQCSYICGPCCRPAGPGLLGPLLWQRCCLHPHQQRLQELPSSRALKPLGKHLPAEPQMQSQAAIGTWSLLLPWGCLCNAGS